MIVNSVDGCLPWTDKLIKSACCDRLVEKYSSNMETTAQMFSDDLIRSCLKKCNHENGAYILQWQGQTSVIFVDTKDVVIPLKNKRLEYVYVLTELKTNALLHFVDKDMCIM